jgi:O-antigen ligase
MIADRPLLGVGPGNYTAAYPTYSQGKDRVHAYNITLHVAAETGVVGLTAMLIMWGRALLVSYRSALPGTPGVLSFALHGLLLAFFVRSLGEHFLANLAASYRFLVVLGIVFGMVEAIAQSRRDAHAPGSSALRGTRFTRAPVGTLPDRSRTPLPPS